MFDTVGVRSLFDHAKLASLRSPQRRTPMKAMDVFQRLIGKISSQEIKAQIDIIPIAPETSTKQKYNSSAKCGDFEFEPLTEEERENS